MLFSHHGLWPARLLCPWGSPGNNTGVSCHFLLQGMFPTQGSNLHLLCWQADSLPLSHLGSPEWYIPKWLKYLILCYYYYFLGVVKRKKKRTPALNLQMEKPKPRSDNTEEEPEQPPAPQTSGSSGPIKSAPDRGLPW